MVERLALLHHNKKVLGTNRAANRACLHVLPVPAWVSSESTGFLPIVQRLGHLVSLIWPYSICECEC